MYSLLLLYFGNQLNNFNIYASDTTKEANYILFLYVFVFTILLPLVCSFVLRKIGLISSFQLEKREERQWPFTLTACSYLLGFSLIQNQIGSSINPLIIWILSGAQLGVFFALFISLFWKISIHMIGIGGFVGMCILLVKVHLDWDNFLYLSILLSGLVGFARLRLRAHASSQVLVGFLLGLVTQIVFVFLI